VSFDKNLALILSANRNLLCKLATIWQKFHGDLIQLLIAVFQFCAAGKERM